MKKLNLLFIVLSLVFTACSKDDKDQVPDTSGNIVGSWKVVDHTYSGKSVVSMNGQNMEYPFSAKMTASDYVVSFQSPNIASAEGFMTFQLTVAGQTTTETVEDVVVDATWVKNGNTLIFTDAEEVIEYKIIELTANKLVMTYSAVEDTSEPGLYTSTTTINGTVTLTRI